VVSGLITHFGSKDLAADAAVVCLDWKGRGLGAAGHARVEA
jgi:hypothetical protein